MIGFDDLLPSSWLDGIFVVRPAERKQRNGPSAPLRRAGHWAKFVAIGTVGACVLGAQLELPLSYAASTLTASSSISQAKSDPDPVSQDIARLRQSVADLRRQIRRGELVNPDAETLGLASQVAEKVRSSTLGKDWAEEVAKSFSV